MFLLCFYSLFGAVCVRVGLYLVSLISDQRASILFGALAILNEEGATSTFFAEWL